MKKILKISAILLTSLVLLVIVLGIILAVTIDPNEYKTEITQAVKQTTGRDLKINGKIGLSFFPWLGVKFKQLELSNATGFGSKPFAQIESAGVKLKVLPLLTGNIEIGKVTLKGLTLNLAVDSQGRNNWDDLAGAGDKADTNTQTSGDMPHVTVGGLRIKKANIHYDDRQSRSSYTIENLNLRTGQVELGQPVDLKLSFVAKSTDLPVDAEIDLTTTLDLNLNRQTATLSNLRLQFADLTVTGTVEGRKIFDNPVFSGKINIARFNLGKLLKAIGSPIETTDRKALTQVGINTEFSLDGNQLHLKGLDIALDDTQVSGQMNINLDNMAIGFKLALDKINLDRYLPPASSGSSSAASSGNEVIIPVKDLRSLNGIHGQLTIGQLQAFGLRSTKVQTTIKANNNVIVLGPSRARLYGGGYRGRIVIDVRSATPKLTLDERVSGIQLKPFLTDADIFKQFTGKAHITIKATASGKTANQIMKTLSGNMRASIANGVLEGIDTRKVDKQIRAIVKQYKEDKKHGPIAAFKKAKKAFSKIKVEKGDRTPFSQLKGSATISNGIVTNNDLVVEGPHVHLRGKGTVNLINETLPSYELLVSGYRVIIKGPYTEPDKLKIRVDWKAALKKRRERKKAIKAKKKEENKKRFKRWKERWKKKWKR